MIIILNKEIFREYDIRGIADTDLTDENVELITKAYASFMNQDKILIGRDNRKSGKRIRDIVVKTLLSTGIDVIDVGITISPIFYYARILYNIDAAIMITASHNSKEFNGFKVCKGKHTMFGENINKVYEIANSKEFSQKDRQATLTEKNPLETYYNMLKEKIILNKKFKVVVDCGNGTASLFASQAFKNWGCEVIELYCDSDPDFPNHQPDPVKESNMKDLILKVKETNADLGIGIDGDGDRIGVIDEKGNMIWGDTMLILYFRELLKKYPNHKCIIEVKCSQALVDDVKAHGGIPMFYKTGHSLIKNKMLEEGALLTGEMSGHMFFKDEFFGTDDALYAAGRLLRIMDNENKTLSELLLDAPKYYPTPELRLFCPDSDKFRITKEIVDYFKNSNLENIKEIVDIDGVRVIFNNGWGLIRNSNTQPALIVRAEGTSPEARDEIKEIIFNKLREYPQVKLEE